MRGRSLTTKEYLCPAKIWMESTSLGWVLTPSASMTVMLCPSIAKTKLGSHEIETRRKRYLLKVRLVKGTIDMRGDSITTYREPFLTLITASSLATELFCARPNPLIKVESGRLQSVVSRASSTQSKPLTQLLQQFVPEHGTSLRE